MSHGMHTLLVNDAEIDVLAIGLAMAVNPGWIPVESDTAVEASAVVWGWAKSSSLTGERDPVVAPHVVCSLATMLAEARG